VILIARLAAALVIDEGSVAARDEQCPAVPAAVARKALSVWHSADGAKGRRLLAGDLANDNRVAAVLAWHFEPDTSGRPHLVTAAAVRQGVDRALEAEYLVALWVLVCVAAAIDRRTIARGRVGLVRDSAIDIDLATLKLLASGAAAGPTGTTASTTSSRPEFPRSARARCARLRRPSASAGRHAAQRRTHRARVALAPAVRRRTRRFRP
jgi:hypothetical protein